MKRSTRFASTVLAFMFSGSLALGPVAALADSGFGGLGSGGTGAGTTTTAPAAATGTSTSQAKVTSLTLPRTTVSMEGGESRHLIPVLVGGDSATQLQWSVSDSAVAYVDSDGYVFANGKGSCTVTVSVKGQPDVKASCQIIVVNQYVDLSEYEGVTFGSEHDYRCDTDDHWYFCMPMADSIRLTFDPKTDIEDGFDYLAITDDAGMTDYYTGKTLAGQTITVEGSSFDMRFKTDNEVTAWGFQVTKIEPVISDGWHEVAGEKYYYVGGKPASGKQVIDGVTYEFDATGRVKSETLGKPTFDNVSFSAAMSGKKLEVRLSGSEVARVENAAFEVFDDYGAYDDWFQATRNADGSWSAFIDMTPYANGTCTVKCWATAAGETTAIASKKVENTAHPATDFSGIRFDGYMDGSELMLVVQGGTVASLTQCSFHIVGPDLDTWVEGYNQHNAQWTCAIDLNPYRNGDYLISAHFSSMGGNGSKDPITVTSKVHPTAKVPNVVGMTYIEAEDALSAAGFDYEVEFTGETSSANSGYVTQIVGVRAGDEVQVGTVIKLKVAGTQFPLIPNVIGKNIFEAESAIAEAGFCIQEAPTSTSDSSKVGLVYDVNPMVGTPAGTGTTVTIYYYSGSVG